MTNEAQMNAERLALEQATEIGSGGRRRMKTTAALELAIDRLERMTNLVETLAGIFSRVQISQEDAYMADWERLRHEVESARALMDTLGWDQLQTGRRGPLRLANRLDDLRDMAERIRAAPHSTEVLDEAAQMLGKLETEAYALAYPERSA